MAGLFTVMRALDSGMAIGRLVDCADAKRVRDGRDYDYRYVEIVYLDRHSGKLVREGARHYEDPARAALQIIEDPQSWYLVDPDSQGSDSWVRMRRFT